MATSSGLKKAIAEAVNAIGAKDGARALRCASAAHRLAPADPEANFVMGLAHEGLGKLPAAETYYRACLAQAPDHVRVLTRLGLLSLNARKGADAVALLERAVGLDPANVAARHYLARAYGLTLRFADAAATFEIAYRQRPRDAEILAGYARATALTGRSEAALDLYRKAKALNPRDDAVQQGIAMALIRMGREDEAEPHLRSAIQLRPSRGTPYLQLAQTGRLTEGEAAAAEAFAASATLSPEEQSTFMLASGIQREKEGRAAEAFAHVSRANAIRDRTRSYDREAMTRYTDQIVAAIAASTLEPAPHEAGPMPLLIMGMPRSGTTLVEQMFSRHSSVEACGERAGFDESRNAMRHQGLSYPENVAAIAPELAALMRAQYSAGLPPAAAKAARFTDKLPDNVFNLPLIRRLFSEARIVICRRNPLDIAWSIFKQGFGPQVPYATDLGNIAHHMRQQDKIITRWLEADAALTTEVVYENMVETFPATARRLVAFAGLAWEDACENLEASSRTVLTASAAQVRRKVYNTAAGRWRALSTELAGIAASLADLIEAHERKLAARR